MTKKPHEDFSYEDYKEVHTVMIEEELTEDEVKEGLEAEIYTFYVCLTDHSLYRMYQRDIEWEEIESVVSGCQGLFGVRNGEDFEILSKEGDVQVAGIMVYHDRKYNLIIKTVVKLLQSTGSYKKIRYNKNKDSKKI